MRCSHVVVAVVVVVCLVGGCLMTGPAQAQDGDSLIRNGDFQQGLSNWTIEQPCTNCWMEVTGDDASGRKILMWERTGSNGSGSAISARQVLDADVSGYDHLQLNLFVRVGGHSLPNSGWWSDQHGGSGEYPVLVRLLFADAAGQPFEWSLGFLITHDGSTQLRNYTIVPAGQWVQYETDVFAPAQWLDPRGAPLPAPARLTGLVVGGSGWDFSGAAAFITLTGTPVAGGGGPQDGSGDQQDLTGSDLHDWLVVEEYPLVSASEDSPDHFEFRQRLTEQILDVRRVWREPDPMLRITRTSELIGPWGYSLGPTPSNASQITLYHNGTPLISDITYVWPLAVASSGTDFRLLINSMSQPTLVVTPDTVGQFESTHFAYIAPVFVGDDLVTIYADWDRPAFEVRRNGVTEYVLLPQEMFVEPPVKALWSWNGHWVLQTDNAVIIDGQSLNDQIGAAEVFGWQLIAGQPFYFFTHEGRIAMSFAGQIVEPYRYDQVVHNQCCEASMFNISGNGTMVWFYALRDGTWYYVEAGVYGE